MYLARYVILYVTWTTCTAWAAELPYTLPLPLGEYPQQIHRTYTTDNGLSSNDIVRVAMDGTNRLLALTADGSVFSFGGEGWSKEGPSAALPPDTLPLEDSQRASLLAMAGTETDIRQVARHGTELAVASRAGLFLFQADAWHRALPRAGVVGWAPEDVRAVAYEADGTLWFAAPQGVGRRKPGGVWSLYTGAEGLPFNDFTCMAAGPKGVWFGTTNGALCFRDGEWTFRQGRRWLLDNHVRDIAVDAAGNAWVATQAGISCLAWEPMRLADKARIFEEDIDKYHRRTSFGYVAPAEMSTPGDRDTAEVSIINNDGQRTGMYLGAVSLAYAATGEARYREAAMKAFRALAFLSEVTQGGSHPGSPGLIARAVVPTSEPDPNLRYGPEWDRARMERDALWKYLQPRWPVDATGEWYWQADSSVDELDGHYFGYGIYFDRVCQTEEEKEEVRAVVRRMTDHLITHGYNMVDYDGKPTRWGYLSPDALNRSETTVIERGLRSLAVLNFLGVTHHITGDPKYREAYLELALDHGYAMNGMTQPRDIMGPGNFGQNDDKMGFLNFYHLVRYETDPKLLTMFYHAINRHWQLEQYERCPWANFIYAAACLGKIRESHWGARPLSPPLSAFEEAVETLQRHPLELVDWPMSNAHRLDMVPLEPHLGHDPGTAGRRVDGRPFQIDERYEYRWGRDPYLLTGKGDGTELTEGTTFLLAYYMGRVHGFIQEQ